MAPYRNGPDDYSGRRPEKQRGKRKFPAERETGTYNGNEENGCFSTYEKKGEASHTYPCLLVEEKWEDGCTSLEKGALESQHLSRLEKN